MMELWGRVNSVNVQKALWLLAELGLPFVRRDAGMAFGVVDTPEYRAKNPNGKIPTLVDGDVVVWESNAILRYLALKAGAESLYPSAPAARAGVERWLDWALSTMAALERPLFWGTVRTDPARRDAAAIAAAAAAAAEGWRMIDARLDGRAYLEGDAFTLADVPLGCHVHRWFSMPGFERPPLPALEAWYGRLLERPAYRDAVAGPLS